MSHLEGPVYGVYYLFDHRYQNNNDKKKKESNKKNKHMKSLAETTV